MKLVILILLWPAVNGPYFYARCNAVGRVVRATTHSNRKQSQKYLISAQTRLQLCTRFCQKRHQPVVVPTNCVARQLLAPFFVHHFDMNSLCLSGSFIYIEKLWQEMSRTAADHTSPLKQQQQHSI